MSNCSAIVIMRWTAMYDVHSKSSMLWYALEQWKWTEAYQVDCHSRVFFHHHPLLCSSFFFFFFHEIRLKRNFLCKHSKRENLVNKHATSPPHTAQQRFYCRVLGKFCGKSKWAMIVICFLRNMLCANHLKSTLEWRTTEREREREKMVCRKGSEWK